MDTLAGYVATGIVSLAVGLLLRELEPKVKIVCWSPHRFAFTVPQQPPQPPLNIITHAIAVRNAGRKPAENIEITHRRKPDLFQLQPPLEYEEVTLPSGEHTIRVKSLGPRELFVVQFLSNAAMPELRYIRSSAGPAQQIHLALQRRRPRWQVRALWALILIGGGFVIYWLLRIAWSLLNILGLHGFWR
jgi:hypothetical protein